MTELLFDGDRAYAHLHHLAVEIDGRLGGSDGERQAADYIAGYFRSLGLEVRPQEFTVRSYGLVEKQLVILDPPLGEIPCEVVWLTADTPPEGLGRPARATGRCGTVLRGRDDQPPFHNLAAHVFEPGAPLVHQVVP